MAEKGQLGPLLREMGVTLRRLFTYTKGGRVKYVTGMFLAACRNMIQTVGLGLGAMFIIEAAQGGDMTATLWTIARVVVICLSLVGLYSVGALWLDDGVVYASAKVRALAARHIARIPAAWYDVHHSGDVMSRMLTDMNSGMQNALNMPVQSFLGILLNGAVSLATLFALEWRVALLIVAISGVSLVFTAKLAAPSRNVANAVRKGNAEVSARLTDILASATLLRVHGLRDFVMGLLGRAVERAEANALRQGRLMALGNLLGDGVRLLVTCAVMGVGAWSLSRGWISAPQLIAILQVSSGPINLFMSIGGSFFSLQNALAGTQRVFDLMDVPVPEQDGAVALDEETAIIDAKDVRFGYAPDHRILDGFSLRVEKGRRIALQGPSGGGKSTMLKLLCGLYPGEGEIRIFGREVGKIPAGQLHEAVMYIPQNPHLFMGTVYENIALARPEATRAEVAEAARRAGAHEFIEALDGGYDYAISERGHNLSGGQCQRIALARAFLRWPKLLLLDEPTSALDLHSEAAVTESLGRARDMTMVVATHRPSLLQVMDGVVMVGEGNSGNRLYSAALPGA